MTLKKDPEEEAARRKENFRENVIAVIVVIVTFAVIGWWIWSSLSGTASEEPRARLSVGISPTLGSPEAEVQVFIFSDFECPFCARFARETFPRVEERFIDTGEVEFVYKHYPLTQIHGHALLAAQAAVCAGDQDAFWEYHDILYGNQDALEVNQLLSYGRDIGLNASDFRECVINEVRLPDVLRDKDLGIRHGVTGTPTFFFNGRRVVGDLTIEEFAEEVERERGD